MGHITNPSVVATTILTYLLSSHPSLPPAASPVSFVKKRVPAGRYSGGGDRRQNSAALHRVVSMNRRWLGSALAHPRSVSTLFKTPTSPSNGAP